MSRMYLRFWCYPLLAVEASGLAKLQKKSIDKKKTTKIQKINKNLTRIPMQPTTFSKKCGGGRSSLPPYTLLIIRKLQKKHNNLYHHVTSFITSISSSTDPFPLSFHCSTEKLQVYDARTIKANYYNLHESE